MQTWQIKVLKLEESVLDDLNGFVHEHALYCLLGLMGLLAVLLAWVLAGGLRRRFPQQAGRVPPVIIVQSPTPPPPEPVGIHFRRHTITGGKIIAILTNGRIDSSGEAILAACFPGGNPRRKRSPSRWRRRATGRTTLTANREPYHQNAGHAAHFKCQSLRSPLRRHHCVCDSWRPCHSCP